MKVLKPRIASFAYEVFVELAIPIEWAKLIKHVGEHHYDYLCKEVSRAGVINGIYNVATWNDEETSDKVTTIKVSWRDCDTILKVMEQARWSSDNFYMIDAINTFFKKCMDLIRDRESRCRSDDAYDKHANPLLEYQR